MNAREMAAYERGVEDGKTAQFDALTDEVAKLRGLMAEIEEVIEGGTPFNPMTEDRVIVPRSLAALARPWRAARPVVGNEQTDTNVTL